NDGLCFLRSFDISHSFFTATAAAILGAELSLNHLSEFPGPPQPITLPLSWFEAGPNSPQLDPDDFEVIDFGQTIRLDKFEAGTEAILYEFDPLFRRRDKEQRIDADESFGGALRQLRLQKGLKQSDFSPKISAKEIGRIERGEVKTLHKKTLETLAQYLGVAAEEIETY
ncbi:MAG: helix-turn-helix transcriptional regulator, partial [Chloroflexi bacterium]|nr:helix-turn-helix transcriptional regulator [Chloroflexota bacterium]